MMDGQSAKELVARAGRELLESGLIVRTWGNVSCRAEDGLFAVTPSGRSYETMRPEEIVLCSTADCTYSGNIKPSSEKRLHALIYNERPDAGFIIHTHQLWASCVSAAGLNGLPVTGCPLLGDAVPVAAYGLPGTKKLTKGVGEALKRCPGRAIILSHHGAVCFGKDYEEAFSAARQLEEACRAYVTVSSPTVLNAPDRPPAGLGNSRRTADGFVLTTDSDTEYSFQDASVSGPALIHKVIYENRPDITVIRHTADNWLLTVSGSGKPLLPWLDDFAQLAGRNVRRAAGGAPAQLVKALRGRKAVLVPGGALCCAASEDDARAVELVLRKNALAQLGTESSGSRKTISLPDCVLMNFVYNRSYAKRAGTSS
jgi:L-ribulose-5-phosphate 4-epimerase